MKNTSHQYALTADTSRQFLQLQKGSIIKDEEGNEYIDFFCGAGAVNYGHNNEYIKAKTLEYFSTDGIIHALDMYTVPKREFIETLETKILEPRGLTTEFSSRARQVQTLLRLH